MSKNRTLREPELDEDFDFSDVMGSSGEDAVIGMFGGLVAASNHQMNAAIELTKLIVGKCSASDSEAIFSVFQRASDAVAKNFPLKPLWDQLGG